MSALLVSAVLLVRAPAALSAQLSLSGQVAPPGACAVMTLTFAGLAASITGVQFDLQYDNSVTGLAATVGDALRSSGKSLYLADLAPNKRRFLIIGLNQNLIPDGALINLFLNLRSDAAPGVSPLHFSNVVATDGSGQAAPITATDGAVTVMGDISQGARLQPAGVLNGASRTAGPVAPGEVIALLGSGLGPTPPQTPDPPGPTSLGGVSVRFDGVSAPLLFAAPNQINAVVPFAVAGKAVTQMQVVSQDQVLAALSLSVASSAPAIFTQDSSGVGPGAILGQDSTLNSPSNPAGKGSIVVLFATGGGQTDPPGVDGQLVAGPLPKPLLPISVQIGGQDAEVLYAGAAPDLIAGVLQINCRIPLAAASGPSVPISLKIGAAASPAGVTVAVR